MQTFSKQDIEKLSLKIDGLTKFDGECQVWIGYVNPNRSAKAVLFVTRNGKRTTVSARHVKWMTIHKAVPDGKVLRMTCGNDLCLEPHHMQLFDQAEVLRETVEKHAAKRKMHSIIARRKRSAVNAQLAKMIRESALSGREIARQTGLSMQAICQIRMGRTWTDLSTLQLMR